MLKSKLEIEIKLAVKNGAAARAMLRRIAAQPCGMVREFNTLYETEDGRLARSGCLLRIRRVWPMQGPGEKGQGRRRNSGPGLLTFKEPAEEGRYKMRKETELVLESPENAERILEGIGLRPWFRYEKYRSSFRLPGLPALKVELDETPAGDFLELEGPRQAIDRAARRMGYGPADYLSVSYYQIFLQERERRGLPADAMLFLEKKSANARVLP